MTYFIHCGVLVFIKPETIYSSTYRFIKPLKVQFKEIAEVPNKAPDDYVEFKYLTTEDGNSIYTTETNIVDLILHTTQKQTPMKFNPNLKNDILNCLISYEKGFRKLWKDITYENDVIKKEFLEEMMNVIANDIFEHIKA